MEYEYQGLEFVFNDGTVTVYLDDEVVAEKEIGFDTGYRDFYKWCQYFASTEEMQAINPF